MTIAQISATGSLLRSEQDFLDLLGEVYGQDFEWLAIPISRLHADFFDLRTGAAGAILQKAANYRVKVAIVGNIDERIARSEALAAFARESNRGAQIWFTPDLETLTRKLASSA